MPWIESQKVNESQNLLRSNMYQNTYWTTLVWMRLPNFFSIRELKLKYLSHKRTLWIEEPELKFRKKANRWTQKGTKVQKHKKCKMAWEWGTNGYICLPYVTILWCLSWQPSKGRDKIKFIFSTSKELSRLWNIGSPS